MAISQNVRICNESSLNQIFAFLSYKMSCKRNKCAFLRILRYLPFSRGDFSVFYCFPTPIWRIFCIILGKIPILPKTKYKGTNLSSWMFKTCKNIAAWKNQPSTPKTAQPTPSPIDLTHCAVGWGPGPRGLGKPSISWNGQFLGKLNRK